MNDRPARAAPDATRLSRLSALARRAYPTPVSEAQARDDKERLFTALARRRALPPQRRAWLLAAAAVAAVALIVALLRPRPDLGYALLGGRIDGGYVQTSGKGADATLRFSEGSEVVLEAGSRARIAELTPRGAHLILEGGAARLSVSHLPRADWSVQAGPFRVDVIGTVFDVRWSGEVLEVRLHTGAVVVRGPIAAGEITLQAGQQLVARADGELRVGAIEAPEAKRAPSEAATQTEAPTAMAPPVIAPPASAAAAVTAPEPIRPSWSQRVAAGDYAGVLADAEARGLDASLSEAPLADLGALADAARYRGRSDLARRALLAERARFPGSAAARTAAFLLGRLSEDALGQRAAAIGYYDQYLAESPSGTFASEALGRKMIAVKRGAGVEAARPLAADYLARFPKGAYAAAAQEITGGQ
jgi:ferric-dicitrate binding protein FerR (iron transport regulator)